MSAADGEHKAKEPGSKPPVGLASSAARFFRFTRGHTHTFNEAEREVIAYYREARDLLREGL